MFNTSKTMKISNFEIKHTKSEQKQNVSLQYTSFHYDYKNEAYEMLDFDQLKLIHSNRFFYIPLQNTCMIQIYQISPTLTKMNHIKWWIETNVCFISYFPSICSKQKCGRFVNSRSDRIKINFQLHNIGNTN